ncbi:DUF2264 domain-containing protein [Paenibacillus gansuensis]|uniref:DUF2264 domain-containing protein n=1 Tax=Paenibacillus gansuensis TaxID=306542 RepID=A0ABW5PG55_9BACL
MITRQYWVDSMCRIAEPVLEALAARELKQRLPHKGKWQERSPFAYLEALGRTLAGLAPWLEGGETSGAEGERRARYAAMALKAIDAGTDPSSPDYMVFHEGGQPLVDAAFLAHALVRAPRELSGKLEPRVKHNVIEALKASRAIKPAFNNWLLFSAMVETALYILGESYDSMRVDYAFRQHDQWYKGDGTYGDGAEFHWDYYNSFVIQPMLLDIVHTLGDHDPAWKAMREPIQTRAVRYAAVQERLISPEGTFPAVGRSLAYRFGAFQHLAQMALHRQLPAEVSPASVRCALSAVIQRIMKAPDMFDSKGFLNIGLYGEQPELGEGYITTGSLYLCTTVFLPLGLPADDPFWSSPDEDWTNKRVWSGGKVPIDQALYS